MPGKDDRVGAPGVRFAADSGHARGGSADDASRVSHDASGEHKPLSGGGRDGLSGGIATFGQDRDGRTALGKQTLSGFQLDGTAGRLGAVAVPPPANLRAPSSLLSRPLFLHPVPPFRAASLPPPVAAPLLFAPSAVAPQPLVPVDSAAAQSQTPDVPQPTQPPAEVPSPKVDLSVTSSALDTVSPSIETPASASTVSVAASPGNAIASTTSDFAPEISPIIAPAASLVDTSFTNAETSDIIPVTNSSVGVGGKVAAACVISAVFLLLLNWAFWLVIRRRRRARRSLPANWDFSAPPPRAKGKEGRESEDAFTHSEDERVAKGGMATVPV